MRCQICNTSCSSLGSTTIEEDKITTTCSSCKASIKSTTTYTIDDLIDDTRWVDKQRETKHKREVKTSE